MLQITNAPFLQSFHLPGIPDREGLHLMREDLVHPFAGGNKWRKLKYNLIDFMDQKKRTILTFGGAFSNHLIATAAAGHQLGIQTIGIIRGEEIENPCINFLREHGMKLHFVNRTDYRMKSNPAMIDKWLHDFLQKKWIFSVEEVLVLPEGGSNAAAVVGTKEMPETITDELIFCACGTGATLAGISLGLKLNQHAEGIPVLKAESFMAQEIERLGGDLSRITLHYDYHFGGYAKTTKELNDFCRDFYLLNQIMIEPVYTGKMLFALQDLLKKETISSDKSITAIHTGGVYDFFPLQF